MLKRLSLLLIAPLTLIFLFAEAPMAFGKSLVLASQFNGKLIDSSGAPQAGVKVSRTWNWAWGDESGSDEATTAEDGSFSFPEVTGSSWSAGIVPHSPSIRQEVKAQGPSGDVLLYSVNKSTYDTDSENLLDERLKGPGVNLICRIDLEPSADGPFWGTCQPAE
ncbi:MAG: carboxypeptidase-like regulatory domain-containing protein [Pseudomonadota bacterium]